MVAKSNWNTVIALVINAYCSVHLPISSRRIPLPPLNNVGKEDEDVAKHGFHNIQSNLHLLSFSNAGIQHCLWGEGRRLVGKMKGLLFQHFWQALHVTRIYKSKV